METFTVTTTNRQWPKDMIMPATARHKLEFWYYGLAELKARELANCLVGQRDTVNRIVEWIKSEVERKVPKDYWTRNEPVYSLVLQNDIGKIANDIYSQYVIHTDKEDVFQGEDEVKVKIFHHYDTEDLENEINEWLLINTVKIINTDFQCNVDDAWYCVMIFYEKILE